MKVRHSFPLKRPSGEAIRRVCSLDCKSGHSHESSTRLTYLNTETQVCHYMQLALKSHNLSLHTCIWIPTRQTIQHHGEILRNYLLKRYFSSPFTAMFLCDIQTHFQTSFHYTMNVSWVLSLYILIAHEFALDMWFHTCSVWGWTSRSLTLC